ncbi:UNVERIFIED_CONTAM: hypothetical protein HDU68_012660 [Siphonaria sp. JEL0065]|nr:hypothetical protein HDU68_012660 [Siphonaria sp. JEL0065]
MHNQTVPVSSPSPEIRDPSPSRYSHALQASERLAIMIELWNNLQTSAYCSNDRAQLCRTLTKIHQTGKCETLNPYGQDEEDVFYACFSFLSSDERGTFLEAAKESWRDGTLLEEELVIGAVLAAGVVKKEKQRDSALCLGGSATDFDLTSAPASVSVE